MAKKFDKKTIAVIRQLKARSKSGKLNEVDKIQLRDLMIGEKTLKDIEAEKDKCRADWLYFINEYVQVKNKFDDPKLIPQILLDRCLGDMIKFVLYDIQVELASAIFNDDKVISTKSRQIGFTTTTLACALWLLTFNNNKTVLLYSKTEKDAKETLSELKFMYDSLPFFLKRTEQKRNEKELVLGGKMNASKIIAQTSGRQSGRSQSATWLIADEADYIEGIESIYKAALFTISATKGKMIVLSTPNLYGSWFYKMIQTAKKKGLKGSGFRLVEGAQDTIPWRDQEWYDEQCKLLNYEKKSIDTELDMKWILPHDTYFHDDKLMKIEQVKEIDHTCNIIKLYHRRCKTDDYFITVDVQEEGTHYNAITLFNLTKNRIEGTCLTRLNPYDTLVELSMEYRNIQTDQRAKIMIERNRGFYLIKKFEENELDYLLLPNIRYIRKTDSYEFDLDKDGKPLKLGFVTTESTRKKALITLSNLLYKADKLPEDLVDEAMKFVIKARGKPVGLEHDDLLMATAICLFTVEILEQTKAKKKGSKKILKFLKQYWKQSHRKHKEAKDKVEKQVTDTIKNRVLKEYLIVQDNNLTGLDLQFYKQVQESNEVSKMGKAMGALM